MPQEETISRGWRRDEWKDHLTLELVKIEITPEDDLKLHISSPDCDCLPNLNDQDGIPILIHNSFDGRELQERHERGH